MYSSPKLKESPGLKRDKLVSAGKVKSRAFLLAKGELLEVLMYTRTVKIHQNAVPHP